MSPSLDTEVKGQPHEVRTLATSLRTTASPTITALADALVDARRDSEDTWSSRAGEAFISTAHDLILPVDGLADFLRSAADALDLLAGELEQSQRLMEAVRGDASAAGLTVDGFLIEDPGPALAPPAPLPPDAEIVAVENHRLQAEAHAAQNARIDAFTTAAAETAEVRARETGAARAWGAFAENKQQIRWGFPVADLAVRGVATGIEARGRWHYDKAKNLLERVKLHRDGDSARPGARSRLEASARRADDVGRAFHHNSRFSTANALSQKVAFRGTGALAVAGVAYDIAVLDKPWYQAAASGAAGVGASVAAGALIGTAIPVPVVGTALGAAGGLVTGILASSVVDRLFESEDIGVFSTIAAGAAVAGGPSGPAAAVGIRVWDTLFGDDE